jgi:hypothetical protein
VALFPLDCGTYFPSNTRLHLYISYEKTSDPSQSLLLMDIYGNMFMHSVRVMASIIWLRVTFVLIVSVYTLGNSPVQSHHSISVWFKPHFSMAQCPSPLPALSLWSIQYGALCILLHPMTMRYHEYGRPFDLLWYVHIMIPLRVSCSFLI